MSLLYEMRAQEVVNVSSLLAIGCQPGLSTATSSLPGKDDGSRLHTLPVLLNASPMAIISQQTTQRWIDASIGHTLRCCTLIRWRGGKGGTF